ncbi:hypothetical protein R8O05_21440 [Vibrio sp. 1865]|uniref:hypothetical protein n=1 Tax=unclassified Vibrio TaxID=2614977 RepID=UPI002964F0CF|nr:MULTISPECIES: hypothetical protein [unclassified Vibrio]MDW2094100.1 hypothetical protein [Vibrio sp. 1866]MDW3103777.1 hypothetical protein [Vibrio sp. 1874]MDW3201879.1 hypothetical protein [Vibrio sp. 1865]
MFAPFSLPSKPIKQVLIREATTAETLDFCDVLPEHEEALTTKFLNTIQDKEAFSDCLEWTAEDRRLALFWYWIHTTEDTFVSLDYDCPHCKQPHTHEFDMRDLAEGYQEISGLASRDLTFEGRKLVISPLTGSHMEELENMRLALMVEKEGSPAAVRKQAEIRFHKLKSALYMADDHEKSAYKRDASLNNWLRELPETKYQTLQVLVNDALASMVHGLPSKVMDDGKIMLRSPSHICPTIKTKENKEVTTELLLPFRNYSRIPRV